MCVKMIPYVGWRGYVRTFWTAALVVMALVTLRGQEPPGTALGIIGPSPLWERWLTPEVVFSGFALYRWFIETRYDIRDIKARLVKLEERSDALPKYLDDNYVREQVFNARMGTRPRGGSRE